MKKKNPNTNCLEGFQCPACKSYGNFWINAMILARVLMSDMGTVEEQPTSTDWDEDSEVTCDSCGRVGIVAEFRK
jgi:hypothetical protein